MPEVASNFIRDLPWTELEHQVEVVVSLEGIVELHDERVVTCFEHFFLRHCVADQILSKNLLLL